ncbi:MAG: shikimate dehydrogenase [Coriobacteriia bacterium]|nr:shikimate dehydrogenase [Coriobacteriia bacterium]
MRINGHTQATAVIGWPITHTLSPAMHNAAYEAMGLNWVCMPIGVPDQRALFAFVEAARRVPIIGFNVTMPYKQAVAELCDEVATLAQMAGAVNTVHSVDGRLIGYNTDGRGLLESLADDASFDPAGSSVAVIGAGGAAGAAVTAFILAKAGSLALVNRDVDRAEQLLERVESRLRGMPVTVHALDGSAASAVRDADLVINATPVGMGADDPSPIPTAWLREGQVVYDMVYRPGTTALVREAQAVGARAFSGLGMLVAQGALAIDIWAGSERSQARAPRDVMRDAAETQMNERATGDPGGGQ